jgi:predicted PurR-regulated permease PerM
MNEQSQTPRKMDSPRWQPGTRLVAGVFLILLIAAIVSRLRQLIVPLILALLLAYILQPLISRLEQRAKMRRWVAVLIVFFVLVLLIAGTTTGVGIALTQAIAGLATYIDSLSTQFPELIESLMDTSFRIGPWIFDLGRIDLMNPVIETFASALQPLLSQTGELLSSVAGATATAIGTTLAILVLSFYLSLELDSLRDGLVGLVPFEYKDDIEQLTTETGNVWQAFLRGQIILGLVVGSATALVLAVLRVRFPFALGLVAGLLEFVPMFGPLIAGLLAVLVALFQGSNVWNVTPLTFALMVLIASIIIQQIENNILVPRIIGGSLKMSPLVVLLAVLAGGSMAGVVGVLLAAPSVATMKLWLGYVYSKTVNLETEVTTTTLAETEHYVVWKAEEPDGEPTYHLELGALTAHFFAEEWEEFVELAKNLS